MGRSGVQIWTWTLYVSNWMCGEQVLAGPQYMVAVPAVLEAGAETKFCASLLQPNETLVMTVSLTSEGNNSTLLKQTSSEEFHICAQFKVPLVKKQEVQTFEVEVRGDTFYSKEVRKVMIQVYQPMTFVQTDKPLYLPGQTVHFRVVTLDTKFRPANQLDVNYNRIGQWLNETSNSKIVQLSYTLSSEAREGTYQITVTIGEDKVFHSFKVEKYVLPKFEVKIDTVEEVNIDQEEFQAEVCAKYTFGQPVPGSVKVEICQRCKRYMCDTYSSSHRHTVNKGCATFAFMMSTFTKLDQTVLEEVLDLKANMEEEGTGKISYEVGKLSFIDTPSVYEQGSNVEGKVSTLTPLYNSFCLKQPHTPEGSSTVTVQSPSGQLTFDVNQNNKLLYQEKMLQDLTGKYSLEVKGTACVSMQISLHYNIPTPTDVTTLSVEVTPEVDCTKSHRPKLTLKYSGKETSTNMVILDIKMLSGFVPDPESLKRLKGALLVDRVEQNEDHVLVYITEVRNLQWGTIDLIQELPVENLKPAVVKIYDYYQPSKTDTQTSINCSR
uniref:Alpha-macroglobulin receptor-binding domain-containing protein n=1 Tax=Mastacembelus armatus TaxID=205130 RepID=A0A3Q3LXA0_9TELE